MMNHSFGLDHQEEKKDLLSYYFFKKAFSPEQCAKIIEQARQFPRVSGATFADKSNEAEPVAGGAGPGSIAKISPVTKPSNPEKDETRNSTIRWMDVYSPKLEWMLKELSRMALEANETVFKSDLFGFTENLQFTEYEEKGTYYDWHPDIGPGQNKRKVSIIVQLSDPRDYEGGELELNNGKIETLDKSQGTVILFPSFLLHRVTALTKGSRYSLVCWISGNAWR
jgi:PKHD-type hydroxylase